MDTNLKWRTYKTLNRGKNFKQLIPKNTYRIWYAWSKAFIGCPWKLSDKYPVYKFSF